MTKARRHKYLQRVADAGIARDERTKTWHMKTYLCAMCKYHEIETEYGEYGSKLASYPICTHPLPAVSEAFDSASECQYPWYPPELPPVDCWSCGHVGHPDRCWHDWCAGDPPVDFLVVHVFTCRCRVITPPRFDVSVNTVWDCWGFRPAIDKAEQA